MRGLANISADVDARRGAVDTALALLDLVDQTGTLRVTDVSKSLNISSSAAHRLLVAFERNGFVRQERKHSAYSVGPKLVRIAGSVVNRLDIGTATTPFLSELAEELDESVAVAVFRGLAVEFVASIPSRRQHAVPVPIGMRLPTHASAAGKALIADLPRPDLEQLYPAEELPRFTRKTIGTRERLLRDLQRSRERGYAAHLEERHPDIIAYACPIRDLVGTTRAAFVVVGPASRLRQSSADVIAATLRRAAHAAMGFHVIAG